jgi:hypothetical protein
MTCQLCRRPADDLGYVSIQRHVEYQACSTCREAVARLLDRLARNEMRDLERA